MHVWLLCRDIECQAVVFAPPACAAKSLASECRDYVTSVVVADDIIMRLTPAALARLHGSLANMSPEEIHEVMPQFLSPVGSNSVSACCLQESIGRLDRGLLAGGVLRSCTGTAVIVHDKFA